MTADLGDHSLPPDLAEVARRELNETPAARTECLIQFRRRLTRNALCYGMCSDDGGEEDGYYSAESSASSEEGVPDDRFLLRFLRSKKFDVQRSYAMYKNYHQFFRDHPELSLGLDDIEKIRHVWDAGVVGGLKERDAHGRGVLLTFPGRWDPALHSLEDVLRALVLQLEFMIASEETQVRGFVLVADFTDFSLYQMRSLKPWYFQTMSTLMQVYTTNGESLPFAAVAMACRSNVRVDHSSSCSSAQSEACRNNTAPEKITKLPTT